MGSSIRSETSDSTKVIVRAIILEGNKITKDYIVLRELQFRTGDTIDAAGLNDKLKKSSENLMNTSLFNFVTITPDFSVANEVKIRIKLTERWYIWPIPEFDLADRNFNTWWKTKDFNRVNYGVDLTAYNFRGRKEILSFVFSLGYDENYGISYTIPYINKEKTLGLNFGTNIVYNHEIALKTFQNKIVFFKLSDINLKTTFNTEVGLTYRRNIHTTHDINIGYNNYHFADTVLKVNTDYSVNTTTTNVSFINFSYQFKRDYRDYKPYPLNGSYFDVLILKNGIGLLNKESINTYCIESSYRRYWKLYQRFYLASGLTLMQASESPYFLQNGLGYGRDFVRSYEYYVINGQSFGLLKTNFKYNLIPSGVKKIKLLSTEKFNTIPYAFYVNLYADLAYVYSKTKDANNPLNNELLIGTGVGLDFVTYYDKVLRLEYSINKKGERGIFIHFMTSI